VSFELLGPKLSEIYRSCSEKHGVVLRADKRVEYGFVVQVMGAIREAGIEQIGMVTEAVTASGANSGAEGRIDGSSGL